MAELTRKGLLAGGVAGAAALAAVPTAEAHGGRGADDIDAHAGTFESTIRDLSGVVVFTARGTVAADRIAV